MPTPDSLAKLIKSDHQHKYDHGHAFVLAGGLGRGGAARLAARGALRVGAGLVTVGCPPGALIEHATHLTAIMCRKVQNALELARTLEDRRLNALCVGPGLGLTDDARALLDAALASRRSIVLDADALTLIGENHDALHNNCVLTPHDGEFARLFPRLANGLRGTAVSLIDRADAAVEAAALAGCTVLLKGPDTIVASPNGLVIFPNQDRSAPWLATAGSGDVLAGIITGLLARGFPPTEAAEIGAWLHMEAARVFGPGLIAEDLPEMLPRVFRALEEAN